MERLHKMTEEEAIARGLPPGAASYRGCVGGFCDIAGALQFNILTSMLGLKEQHYLLDIGCGSLRGGKLFIPYLLPNRYFGIEPERWLIEEGIEGELGKDILRVKKPTFDYNEDFQLTIFNQEFHFLLAKSIFTHAGPNMVRTCLMEAKKVMKPDAVFVATYLEGATELVEEGWCPGARFYKEETLRGLVEAAGLIFIPIDISGFCPPNWDCAADQQWALITHLENEANVNKLFEDDNYHPPGLEV